MQLSIQNVVWKPGNKINQLDKIKSRNLKAKPQDNIGYCLFILSSISFFKYPIVWFVP